MIKAKRSGRRSSSVRSANSVFDEVTEFEFQIVAEPTSQVTAENVSSTGREQENSKRPEEPAVPV